MSSIPRKFHLKFIEKEKISASDAYSFYFSRIPIVDGAEVSDIKIDYRAGQYFRFTIEGIEDQRGTGRFFSSSASPTEEYIVITTRIIQSEFKKRLVDFHEGELILTSGPFGSFILDTADTRPKVFIAGGIGITPFRSMAIYARDTHYQSPITFFSSFSTGEEVVFEDELKAVENVLPTYKYITTVSHPELSKTQWNGETGRLTSELFKKYISNPADWVYFIAGPEGLVRAMVEVIKSLGVAAESIIIENFTGY